MERMIITPNNTKLLIIGNEWRLINDFKGTIKELNSTLKETNKILEKLTENIKPIDYQIFYTIRNELKKYIDELLLK